jgi:hypothetical protein
LLPSFCFVAACLIRFSTFVFSKVQIKTFNLCWCIQGV